MCVAAPGAPRPPTDKAAKAYIWDLPTRLFHWSLVILVVAAFITAKIGGNTMAWHGRIGLAILGLLVFRIVWGFAGSTYARFTQFVRGPTAIFAYLRGEWQGAGHNPVGALSVLALLAALLAQALTGLFANDDIAFAGYLAVLVGNDLSTRISGIHSVLEKILMALVALHIGAIVFYARVNKQNLVKPMFTGWATGKPCESATGGGLKAFIFTLAIALFTVYAASGNFNPPVPPPPAGQALDF